MNVPGSNYFDKQTVSPITLGCLLLAMLAVGCGKETPAAAAAVNPTPAVQPAPSAAPAPAAVPAPAAPASPAALAVSDNENGTGRAEVMELKRVSGDMLMLRIGIVNTGREPMDMGRLYADPKTGDYRIISGITLVDPLNKKKYFTVRDGADNCVCSGNVEDVKPGNRANVWARFPAPPEDVQKLSVLIPHFPPMDEIVIGK